jgi:ATP-dependent exoDNAse (exonuclease V) alpha subunit
VVIVQRNDLRFHINNTKAKQHALALGQKLLINVAYDKSKTSVSTAVRREFLLFHDGPATCYLAGLLPLFIGMLVMIKKNYATELGISNGSTGVIYDIVIDPRETIDYNSDEPHFLRHHPISVYVLVNTPKDKETRQPEVKFHLHGLPANVFMMTRDENKKGRPLYATLTGSQLKKPFNVSMQREQYRFLPAYAITVNSSQGRTLKSAVVCLEGDFKYNVKPYVMLSRLTNGDALGIIGKVSSKIWLLKPNGDMKNYLEEKLYPKARETVANLNHGVLKPLENTLRNAI